ncbi:MAG: OmpA family protein [Cyclobacteriaceae bacterium]|nr:OmpA family protein [Cyclobacteriaceae bacterium]
MKNSLRSFLLLAVSSISTICFSQNTRELAPGYYVVVGAYAKSRENIAQNYVETLVRKGLTADYGFNPSRNLYFVYLKYFTTLSESLRDMKETRKTPEFSAAWVRVVPGDIGKANSIVQVPVVEVKAEPEKKEVPKSEVVRPVEESVKKDEIEVTDNEEVKQYNPVTLGNTEIFVSLFQGRNNRIVDGEVKVIDTERARLMTKIKGNEYLNIPDPKSKSGQVTLIAEVFGYRKIQQEINYPLPLKDTIKPNIDYVGTTFVINFEMVRYHKGDIAVLYNVFFYNDAAIMSPESQYELNSLLQMLQENPNYKIMLHGHSNGNAHGKIISMGPSKNFFSLTDDVINGSGTSKELSQRRAEVIKEYLVTNGIDASRISIKAWGGKRPLYDKHSVNARQNVRVEVEILQE